MKQMILSRIGFESLRVAFPAACGAKRSRQRARRPAHRCTRTAHPLFSEYPAPWGGDPLFGVAAAVRKNSSRRAMTGFRHRIHRLETPEAGFCGRQRYQAAVAVAPLQFAGRQLPDRLAHHPRNLPDSFHPWHRRCSYDKGPSTSQAPGPCCSTSLGNASESPPARAAAREQGGVAAGPGAARGAPAHQRFRTGPAPPGDRRGRSPAARAPSWAARAGTPSSACC